MSAVGAWILSILGIVLIGAVIDLILPSGRMNKHIKSVFSAVTVLVIVLPLPNLLKNGCNSNNFIFDSEIYLQEDYLGYAEKLKSDKLISGLRAALKSDGITLGQVEISGDFEPIVPQISEVKINMSQVVIVGQSEHINKYELIRSKISQYLAVDEGAVVLYEQ